MGFYDLDKKQRLQLVDKINKSIFSDIQKNENGKITTFFSDNDTYIRKSQLPREPALQRVPSYRTNPRSRANNVIKLRG